MSSLPHALRVLIGDDHRIVREGIKQMLRDPSNGTPEIHVMAEAQTGPQVIDEVAARRGRDGLDVVLLDIALPTGTDSTYCRRCAATGPHCPC